MSITQRTTKSYDSPPHPHPTTLLHRITARISAIGKCRSRFRINHSGTVHSALTVPEILCLIFRCGLSERDLFHCALVCRLWGIWAPDVLWRTCRIPLKEVLKELASVKKSTLKCEGQRIPYVEIGKIKEDGWHRFLAISNKITKVVIDCGLSDASLRRIKLAKQTFKGEPFSRLRTLKMDIDDTQHGATSLVAVPSLRAVSLSYRNLQDDGQVWVSNDLPAIAPNITHCVILPSWDYKTVASQYSSLQHLEIRLPVAPPLWESLSSCQGLTKLVVTRCMEVSEWPWGWSVDYVCFPALRTLKIRGGRAGATIKLISRSRLPMLEFLFLGDCDLQDACSMLANLRRNSPKLDVDMVLTVLARTAYAEPYDHRRRNWVADSDDDCC